MITQIGASIFGVILAIGLWVALFRPEHLMAADPNKE